MLIVPLVIAFCLGIAASLAVVLPVYWSHLRWSNDRLENRHRSELRLLDAIERLPA